MNSHSSLPLPSSTPFFKGEHEISTNWVVEGGGEGAI